MPPWEIKNLLKKPLKAKKRLFRVTLRRHCYLAQKLTKTALNTVWGQVDSDFITGHTCHILGGRYFCITIYSKTKQTDKGYITLYKSQYWVGWHVKWVENLLYCHAQRVVINVSTYGWYPVWRKVPQGSILGPVFFIIFITVNVHVVMDDDTDSILSKSAENAEFRGWLTWWMAEFWSRGTLRDLGTGLTKSSWSSSRKPIRFWTWVNNPMHQYKLGCDCPAENPADI